MPKSSFDDVKTFLWLASVEGVVAPPPKIDAAWHVLLLFTEDYQAFCKMAFGRFMHHRPTRPEDKPDGGLAIKKTIEAVENHFGGFGGMSNNWHFRQSSCWGGSCSSNSVSCAPTPSCDSGLNLNSDRQVPLAV